MIQQEKRTCVKVAHRGPVVLGKRCTLNYEKRPLNAATRSQRVLSRTVAPRWGAEGRTQSSASREGSAVSARRATCPWAEHGEGTHAADVQALCGPAGAEGPGAGESARVAEGGPPASSAPGRCARHARVHCSRRRHRGPRDPSGNPAVAPRACERCPDTRGPRTRRTGARRAPRRPRTRGTSARRGSAPGRALRSAPGASLWRRSRCGPCSLSNARL